MQFLREGGIESDQLSERVTDRQTAKRGRTRVRDACGEHVVATRTHTRTVGRSVVRSLPRSPTPPARVPCEVDWGRVGERRRMDDANRGRAANRNVTKEAS